MREEIKKMKQETHNLPTPDDAPWLNLSQEEVNELRSKKFDLTEYGKHRLKELIYKQDMHKMEDVAKDLVLENLTHEEMTTGELMDTEKFQEEFSKSQVFDADKFEEENSKERSNRILERYNYFYNTEVSGLAWGTHITAEFQQAMVLECMLDALRYENLNHEFSEVQTADINALIEGLYQQGKDYLERVNKTL
jgi:hypothetical protein